MLKVIYEVELREQDIDNNKIDTKKLKEDIFRAISHFWNVASVTIPDELAPGDEQ